MKGTKRVDLTWSGTSVSSMDVFRNGSMVATVSNTGSYTDAVGGKGGGSFTYQVCEASTSTCSAEKTVVF